MRGVVDLGLREKVVQLRVQQRMSLNEIHQALGVSKGSLSAWLQDHPLTEEERKTRASLAKRYTTPKKDRGQPSAAFLAIDGKILSPAKKAEIAEAAVLFRLVLHDFHVMSPIFDCAKVDWFVEVPETHKILRLQVKYITTYSSHGLPNIHLTCSEGHSGKRRYQKGEFDFIVGYDLFTDTAYVYSYSEVEHLLSSVTITQDSAENWSKLRINSGDII